MSRNSHRNSLGHNIAVLIDLELDICEYNQGYLKTITIDWTQRLELKLNKLEKRLRTEKVELDDLDESGTSANADV